LPPFSTRNVGLGVGSNGSERIVVELQQDEFQTLNAAIGPWVAPADHLRILALRVIAEVECNREP
jgi:hypothetical protein